MIISPSKSSRVSFRKSSGSGSPSPGISNPLKSLQSRAVQAPLTNALHHTHIPKSPGKTVLLQAEVPLHGVLWRNNRVAVFHPLND